MVYYFILFVSLLTIIFILKKYRYTFYSIAENSVELIDILITNIDENTKIKLVKKSNNKLLASLLKIFLIGSLAIILGSIPILLYLLISKETFNNLEFTTLNALIAISLGATIPFLLPQKTKDSDYSELSQLLHRIALNNYQISNKLFKKESKKIKLEKLELQTSFVIVSGLARAGTTSLMNDLAKINKFVSLNYANMPFLLCPNFWAKVYKPKTEKTKERSHKDGIKIGVNSNEALEEYFFKVKANDSYITDEYLKEYKISEDVYKDYLTYQSIIKRNNQKTYLAKNNNFILRYKSVREFNNDFIMVVLFRDPFMHASSLMEKHRDYLDLQQKDPFVLEYMNWLGHHEFGLDQKPFYFNKSDNNHFKDKKTLDYWLYSWINYYTYALSFRHSNTIFINYDEYCMNPKSTVKKIISKTNLKTDIPEFKPFINKRKNTDTYSDNLKETADKLFQELKLATT